MKRIRLSKVLIPEAFRKTRPNREKIKAAVEYLRDRGVVDKPIVLDGLVLTDGYTRYLAALELKHKIIEYVDVSDCDDLLPIRCIVAKFDNKEKEYTWRVTDKTAFKPGDRAVVMSTHYDGIDYPMEVGVVRYFETIDTSYRCHKNVIYKVG